MGMLASACARQGAPSGGPEDVRPPGVVRTFPEPLGRMTDLDGTVRFEFDERISERVQGGSLEEAVSISPRSGTVRVSHGSRSLTVGVEGGFLPDVVYRVTLNPVVSDLFGNRLADPFELVFTTGDGELVPTTLAGEVWDRVSGQPVQDALVVAAGTDGVVHQSSSDREGIFAFRYLPQGRFDIIAFRDENRNREVDSTEVQGATTVDMSAADTLLTDISVLEPDTAAAVVSEARALDSVTVAVTFDDYLDPAADASEIEVSISAAGAGAHAVQRIFHEGEYARYVEAVSDSLARLDSIDAAVADTAAPVADTVAPVADTIAQVADTVAQVVDPADTVRIRPPARPGPPTLQPLQGARPGPTQDGRRVLPGRRIVLLVSEPLTYDVEHEVRVSGVVNINGLTGGGGVAPLVLETPAVDTTSVDSLAAPDTGVVPDTGTGPSRPEGRR